MLRDAYGIDAHSISKIDFPSHNYVYKATTGDAAYVVKIFSELDFTPRKSGSKTEHIDYESEILDQLERCNAPAVPALHDRHGNSVHAMGSRKAMVFRYINGHAFNGTPAHIANAARALAQVHRNLPENAIATRDFDYRTFISLWINRLPALRADPRFDECISDTAGFDKLTQQIEGWLKLEPDWEKLTWVHGHGDLHPRNFLFQGDTVFAFDFQAARFMPRLEDIADGMIEFGIHKDALTPERMECFLAHYEAIFPLSAVERSHLNEFLLAEAATKILTTLEGEFLYGYKAGTNRMKALLDFCLTSQDLARCQIGTNLQTVQA